MTAAEFAQIRAELGLTQAQLGHIMGMRGQEISRIERKTGPTKQQTAFILYIEATLVECLSQVGRDIADQAAAGGNYPEIPEN